MFLTIEQHMCTFALKIKLVLFIYYCPSCNSLFVKLAIFLGHDVVYVRLRYQSILREDIDQSRHLLYLFVNPFIR